MARDRQKDLEDFSKGAKSSGADYVQTGNIFDQLKKVFAPAPDNGSKSLGEIAKEKEKAKRGEMSWGDAIKGVLSGEPIKRTRSISELSDAMDEQMGSPSQEQVAHPDEVRQARLNVLRKMINQEEDPSKRAELMKKAEEI